MATLHAQHQKAHGEPSGFPPQGQHGNHRALVSCGKYPRSGGTSARLQANQSRPRVSEGLLPGELLGWCGELMEHIQEPSTGLSDWERLPEGTAEAPLLDSNTNLP